MTRTERRWDVSSPRIGRYTPAHCSSAGLPSTEVKRDSIAAAPPAGLKRKYGTASAPSSLAAKRRHLPLAAAPAFMPTSAAAKRLEKKPEMDPMFLGGQVDGSNEEITPLSIQSNVRSSARSTGSSPNEKSRSPEEVTSMMDKNLHELLESMQNKWDTRQKELQDEWKEVDMKVGQVMQMARECGANEKSTDLWLALYEIIQSERATKFFMGSDPVVRMAIIKHYARVLECRETQPRDLQIKSHLKRDAKPATDYKKEWEEEFFNIAGLLDLSKKFQHSGVVGLLGLSEAKLAEDSKEESKEDFSTSS